MAAVVEEPALVAPLGHGTCAELLEPCLHTRGAPERVDDELGLHLPSVGCAGSGDANRAVRRSRSPEEPGDRRPALDLDTCLGLRGGPQRALEHRSSDAEGDERLVAGARVAGNELELPVLERTVGKHPVEHVGRLLQQRAPGEAEKIVRLPKMRDPGALPSVEDEVRVGMLGIGHIALQEADAPTPAREPDRRGKPRKPAAHDSDVRSDRPPCHACHHALRLCVEQGHRDAAKSWAAVMRDLPGPAGR